MTQPLMGKTSKINFEVEVQAVKNKVLPEVTDEWVKDTLGFENVADLRTRVADSILEQKEEVLPRIKENQCLSKLADRLQGDVPEAMCEEAETSLLQDFFQQLQRQGVSFDAYLKQQGITPDRFKEDVKAQAADMTKQDLALDAWARHYNMEVTDEDVAEEFVKSGVEDPKKLQEEWRRNGQLHMVKTRHRPHEGRRGRHGEGRRDRSSSRSGRRQEGRGKEARQEGRGQEDRQEGRGHRPTSYREEAGRQEGRPEEGCEEGRGRRRREGRRTPNSAAGGPSDAPSRPRVRSSSGGSRVTKR